MISFIFHVSPLPYPMAWLRGVRALPFFSSFLFLYCSSSLLLLRLCEALTGKEYDRFCPHHTQADKATNDVLGSLMVMLMRSSFPHDADAIANANYDDAGPPRCKCRECQDVKAENGPAPCPVKRSLYHIPIIAIVMS
ncbi:hypothetical protein V8C26DRAFT_246206 [Trichoderma gracile]